MHDVVVLGQMYAGGMDSTVLTSTSERALAQVRCLRRLAQARPLAADAGPQAAKEGDEAPHQ